MEGESERHTKAGGQGECKGVAAAGWAREKGWRRGKRRMKGNGEDGIRTPQYLTLTLIGNREDGARTLSRNTLTLTLKERMAQGPTGGRQWEGGEREEI